ncbi:hypothetical protein ACFX2I_020189 [Malus domestica]
MILSSIMVVGGGCRAGDSGGGWWLSRHLRRSGAHHHRRARYRRRAIIVHLLSLLSLRSLGASPIWILEPHVIVDAIFDDRSRETETSSWD